MVVDWFIIVICKYYLDKRYIAKHKKLWMSPYNVNWSF